MNYLKLKMHYQKYIDKMKNFLHRDSDISYRDEWGYIYMTLKETVLIILTK